MRVADLLIRTLKAAGTTRIFSLSGNQIMPLYDACIDAEMEILHCRHEAAALYMAEAHAQLTGTPGVALVTAGAGVANALAPLLTAAASETPVLLLSGDSPRSQDGRGAFQEMAQVPMTAPLTKLSLRLESPERTGEDLARALRTSREGRPGPVHISLPVDVLNADAGAAAVTDAAAFWPPAAELAPDDRNWLRGRLATADRPVVLCGPLLNPTRAGDVTRALGAALGAPVIAMESPRGLRDPALGRLTEVLGRADLIVSLGKRIDFTLGFGASPPFATDAAWVVVEPEREECDRARRNLEGRIERIIRADPAAAATALSASAASCIAGAGWAEEAAQLLAHRDLAQGEQETGAGSIHPATLCAAVERTMDGCAAPVLIADGGEFGQWAQAGLHAPRRMINGMAGAIGGGLCYALAAAKADPGAQVFALMGDGTVGFHLAEFETAVRAGAPFIAVIGNDMRWNAEHQIQMRSYGEDRGIGCALSAARYDLAVAALGGHGEYVTRAADLDAALARALVSGKPACVNVMIEGAPAPGGAGH